MARRGPTRIVRTHHGFVMAAAGVDASNVAAGSLVLLPLDPDASARRLRDGLRGAAARASASWSATPRGAPWRNGQTDIALGAAGLPSLDDHAGRRDAYGNDLVVTAPAVADEVAALAELATGKLSGSPAAWCAGSTAFVLPAGEPDPGAAALVRPEATDMFGLGAREAVLAALGPSDSAAAPRLRRPRRRRGAGRRPADGAGRSRGDRRRARAASRRRVARPAARARAAATPWAAPRWRCARVAHAHGWQVGEPASTRVRVGPRL